MHHTVQNILNVTNSLLMLLFVQPSSGNSDKLPGTLQFTIIQTLIKILYSLLNGVMLTGSVRRNFQNVRYFSVSGLKD